MFDLDKIVRENIKKLVPYSSARDEFKGKVKIRLDANENSFGSPLEKNYSRYPDPLQFQLKRKIAAIKKVPVDQIFLGNGSDEAIDLLFRAFCRPETDNVILIPPTYGMYEVAANINDVMVKNVRLDNKFQLDLKGLFKEANRNTKLIFLCSPNNPTGNSLRRKDIEFVLENFNAIVVLDEAYIDFSKERSFTAQLASYPNLVVLQTFSKAWGLAGLRIGMAFASERIVSVLNKIKPPYNINGASQELALRALDNAAQVDSWTKKIIVWRKKLISEIGKMNFVRNVFPSDANFILVKMEDAGKIYRYLSEKGIIVRNRSSIILCEDCLRVTIGTDQENRELIEILKQYSK